MSNDSKITKGTLSQQDPGKEQRIFTFKANKLIWLLFGILEVFIVLRIALMLIGANPNNPIVAMIYGITYLFLFPIIGLTGASTISNMVLEISSMFAIVIYGLIAFAVERTVWLIFYRPHVPLVGTTQTTTSEHHTTP